MDVTERPAPAEPQYKPKPPLWQSKPDQTPLWRRVAWTLVILEGMGGLLALGLESYLLVGPVEQVEVPVVRLQVGQVATNRPAAYVHFVALADGSGLPFTAREIHKPGERLSVTLSRGLVTRRVWLLPPYQLVLGVEGTESRVPKGRD